MFNQFDRALLVAFLNREAADFSRPLSDEWVNFRIKKIEESLIGIQVDYIRIQSMTNMGCLARELVLSPPNEYWDWEKGDLEVILCSCGRDEHWGHGRVIPRTPRGIANLSGS